MLEISQGVFRGAVSVEWLGTTRYTLSDLVEYLPAPPAMPTAQKPKRAKSRKAARPANRHSLARMLHNRVMDLKEFLSDAAKGKAPSPTQVKNPVLHEGISVFDNLSDLSRGISKIKSITHIAELKVPSGVGELFKTLSDGHWTWVVDPKVAVNTVVKVFSK